jgi:abelson tyrosine-protein kinase 1
VAQSVLGTAGVVTHELLGISVELLKFAPMPGLQPGAQILLYVWDAVEQVDVSFLFLFFFFCIRAIDEGGV